MEDSEARAVTPTQSLLMEQLASRTRLGESLWTFDQRFKKQLEELQSIGLVNVMHGITEKTVRASLTEVGKAEYLSDSYTSPLEAEVEKLRREVRKLKRLI